MHFPLLFYWTWSLPCQHNIRVHLVAGYLIHWFAIIYETYISFNLDPSLVIFRPSIASVEYRGNDYVDLIKALLCLCLLNHFHLCQVEMNLSHLLPLHCINHVWTWPYYFKPFLLFCHHNVPQLLVILYWPSLIAISIFPLQFFNNKILNYQKFYMNLMELYIRPVILLCNSFFCVFSIWPTVFKFSRTIVLV